MKMPWGKFRGREIADVPTSYLAWVLDNVEPTTSTVVLRVAARDELRRRFGGNGTTDAATSPARLRPALRPIAREIIEAGFRRCARAKHPDHGGTHTDMLALNETIAALRALVGPS